MLLTDFPELVHLPEDQATSVESFSASTQSKIVCLKWIPISEPIHRDNESRDIHQFTHSPEYWMDIMLVYGVQGIGEKAARKQFEELMVFMKGFVGHIPFESGTDDAEGGTEQVAGLEDQFEIVSGLKNEKRVSSFQTGLQETFIVH